MRELHYAGGSMLVGDDVSRAIEDYALDLARRQTADVIVLPATGVRDRIEIVLGPSSQLFSEAAVGPASDERDDEILADLRARRRGEEAAGQPPFEEPSSSSALGDFDL